MQDEIRTDTISILFFFVLLFAISVYHIKKVAAIEKRTPQVILTPAQIKKAVCTGVKDTNGTYIECTVFPVGSKL